MKRVERIDRRAEPHWVGDGFPVRTLFSYHSHGSDIDPFLLLDYAAPHQFAPAAKPRGVGAHPHKGFETVTIVLQGEVEHRDSAGNHGVIGPGDVQWMTAASGLLHEEFHSRAFTQRGGTFEVLQLWVNLPAAAKQEAPHYQDLRAGEIPLVPLPAEAGTARLIAGEWLGARGPAQTHTPLVIADVKLAAGRSSHLPLAVGHTSLLVLRQGSVQVNGGERIDGVALVILSRDGDDVELTATAASEVLLLSGAPIGEPVVGSGPFVMNTEAEIRAAYEDFRAGKMGRLAG